LTYPGKWDNLQEMERTDLGGGRFLTEMSPEEIRNLKWSTETSMHYCLIALLASRKESSTNPEEIQELDSDIKTHLEIIDRLMSWHETSDDPISEKERLIGGVHHAVLEENMSFEEAEARLKLIAELNASDHPAEDK
jgi:hypothetical protein